MNGQPQPDEIILATAEEVSEALSTPTRREISSDHPPAPQHRHGQTKGPGGRARKGDCNRNRKVKWTGHSGTHAAYPGFSRWPSILASCLSPWACQAVRSCFCDKCQRVFANELKVLQHFVESWSHQDSAEQKEATHVLHLLQCQEIQQARYKDRRNCNWVHKEAEAHPAVSPKVVDGAPASLSDGAHLSPKCITLPHSDLYTPSASSDEDDETSASRSRVKDITGMLSADSSARKSAATTAVPQVDCSQAKVNATSSRVGRKQVRRKLLPNQASRQQQQQQRRRQQFPKPGPQTVPTTATGVAPAEQPQCGKKARVAAHGSVKLKLQRGTARPKEDYNSVFPALSGGPQEEGEVPTARPKWGSATVAASASSTRKLRVDAPVWSPKGASVATCEAAPVAALTSRKAGAMRSKASASVPATSNAEGSSRQRQTAASCSKEAAEALPAPAKSQAPPSAPAEAPVVPVAPVAADISTPSNPSAKPGADLSPTPDSISLAPSSDAPKTMSNWASIAASSSMKPKPQNAQLRTSAANANVNRPQAKSCAAEAVQGPLSGSSDDASPVLNAVPEDASVTARADAATSAPAQHTQTASSGSPEATTREPEAPQDSRAGKGNQEKAQPAHSAGPWAHRSFAAAIASAPVPTAAPQAKPAASADRCMGPNPPRQHQSSPSQPEARQPRPERQRPHKKGSASAEQEGAGLARQKKCPTSEDSQDSDVTPDMGRAPDDEVVVGLAPCAAASDKPVANSWSRILMMSPAQRAAVEKV